MSHINFDFLTESFLFGYGLEDNFSALSDYELEKELNRYREYVISNMGEICREIIFDSRKIAVTIESFSERPREELLKQLALYVDVVTISDPLFELTEKKSNSTKVMAKYYGMNSNNTIDREQLVAALKYMKESTILVVCNYVKYIPISYLHEAPMNVPITYDANNYSKSLPQPIMDFLKKNVQVHNTVRMDGGLRVELDKPLTRGTGLFIHFPDCGFRNGEIVQYQESEVVDFDENTRKATFRFFTPDNISQDTFNIWLDQSVNKACLHMYDETFQEVYLAKRALCVKNEQDIVGVLLYSRKHNMICCLAVDPVYRKRGIASLLLKEALDKLDRDKDITVSTFRKNDVKGIAPRKLYKKFGFEEGELIEEFGYPNQRFVLHADRSVDNVTIGTKSYIEVDMERLGIISKRKPAKIIDFTKYIDTNRSTNN